MSIKVFVCDASKTVRNVLDKLEVSDFIGENGVQHDRFTALECARAALEQ